MTPIEITAVIFGFLCVYLTIRESIWCWPAGLIQVFLYIFIFYDARLYSDVILQIIFVALQFYGWYFWLHGGKMRTEVAVSRLSRPSLIGWVIIALLGTALLGYFMATKTDASFPYADAFIAAFSLTAQWLLSYKKLETWYFWIAVDCVAIGVYFAKDLHLTAVLYVLFLVMAIAGLASWKRSFYLMQSDPANVELEPAI